MKTVPPERRTVSGSLFLAMKVATWRWRVLITVVIILDCFSRSSARRFRFDTLTTSPGSKPVARSNAVFHSFVGSNQVVLFGGRTDAQALNDTWIFDSSRALWEQINVVGPSARYESLSVAVNFGGVGGKYVYVIGGRDTTSVLQSSLMWAFQLSTRKWTEVKVNITNRASDSVASAIARASAAGGLTAEKKVLISHGTTDSEKASDAYMLSLTAPGSATIERKLYNTVREYNIGDPKALSSAASAVTPANELIVAGGCYEIGLCPNQDAWAFDLSQREWRYMKRGPSPRQFASMAAALPSMEEASIDPRQTVILWGGLETSKQTFGVEEASVLEVDVLDIRGRKWSRELADASSSAKSIRKRSGASIVLLGDGTRTNLHRYLIFGGALNVGGFTNELLVLFFEATEPAIIVSEHVARMQGFLYVHGILMLISFAWLTPSGVIVARHMRLLTSSPKWFLLHSSVQTLTGVAAWTGVSFAIYAAKGRPKHTHATIGIFLMGLLSIQLVMALPCIRPNPNAGVRRKMWAILHQLGGWAVFSLGIANCFAGLILLVLPIGLWIAFLLAAVAFLFAAVLMELRRISRHDHKDSRYVADDERREFDGETTQQGAL